MVTTGNGGVEGYAVDSSGGERGLQAKLFLGQPTPSQWTSIFDSIKRALDMHPDLVAMTIALPGDRQDPRKPNQQWFMDEWNAEESRWTAHAHAMGRTIRFHYLGTQPAHYPDRLAQGRSGPAGSSW